MHVNDQGVPADRHLCEGRDQPRILPHLVPVPEKRLVGDCCSLTGRAGPPNDHFSIAGRRTYRLRGFQQSDDKFRQFPPHQPTWHTDRSQRRIQVGRHVGVVKTDDTHIIWNSETENLCFNDRAFLNVVIAWARANKARVATSTSTCLGIPSMEPDFVHGCPGQLACFDAHWN